MKNLMDFLHDEGVDDALLDEVKKFRNAHPLSEDMKENLYRAVLPLFHAGGMSGG